VNLTPTCLRLGLIVCALSLASVACSKDKTASPTPTPPASQATASPPPSATALLNVCSPNPAPAQTNLQPTDFGYRQLTAPATNASSQSPLTVAGSANPFEGAFSVTIFNASGQQIAAMNFMKNNLVLSFSVQVPFTVTTPTAACVWVHERSGKDGSPTNITQVPVTLLP
jgi:hypothetical protein